MFLNYIKLAILLILRLQNCEMFVRNTLLCYLILQHVLSNL